MSEIRIYKPPTEENPTFEICGITDFASNDTYSKYASKIGEFEIQIPFNEIKDINIEENYLILINKEFWGIIEDIEMVADGYGHNVNIRGECLKTLLKGRVTLPPITESSELAGYETLAGDSETIIKTLVNNNLVNPANSDRKIFDLIIAENLQRGIADDKYMTRFENLADVIEKICLDAKLGYDISVDLENGKFIFDVFQGKNKVAGQSDYPPIVFSIENNSIKSLNYVRNNNNLKNVFYSTKSGEEYENEALTMTYYKDESNIPKGIARKEVHLNISAEHPEEGKEYEELKRLTLIEAKNYEKTETIEVDVVSDYYKFNVDYSLEDTVTIFDKTFNVQSNMKVNGIIKSHSSNSIEEKLIFGDNEISILAKIKRDINNR